jgi:hypothetical protein
MGLPLAQPPETANIRALSQWVRERFTGSTSTTVTLRNKPVMGTEFVYKNGTLLDPNPTTAYTVSGSTLTLASSRLTGDVLVVSYYFRNS